MRAQGPYHFHCFQPLVVAATMKTAKSKVQTNENYSPMNRFETERNYAKAANGDNGAPYKSSCASCDAVLICEIVFQFLREKSIAAGKTKE
jgi:hypothetical protein